MTLLATVPVISMRAAGAAPAGSAGPGPAYADQGPQWTSGARNQFYVQDQGAQMIPYAWLAALKHPDGTPFLADALARYGYLSNPAVTTSLPVGFALADSSEGPMVGMTCAACHTRQITISGQPYRIDGGPALADFERLLADLDASTSGLLTDAAKFDAFAAAVLGAAATDTTKAMLRADLTLWSVRFHTLMSRSLPQDRHWGPARLDAVSMIFNRVTGLDLGPAPTYLIPDNIVRAGAPTRYPFLWNASKQDHTQWPGFAPNGNDLYALSRNLGEVYGVFGTFHPDATTGSVTLFDRNYVVHNSANFAGLWMLEGLIKRIGPPAWQWDVDPQLAARGKTIYDQVKTGPGNASCGDCHGIQVNYGILDFGTWKTPIQNVGTDVAEWAVMSRYAATGSLEGASIPEVTPTLLPRDLAISILKISVAGAIGEHGASTITRDVTTTSALAASPAGGPVLSGIAPGGMSTMGGMSMGGMSMGGMSMGGMSMGGTSTGVSSIQSGIVGAATAVPTIVTSQTAATSLPQLGTLFRLPGLRSGTVAAQLGAPPPRNAYESRVLQGIWAAAPYLHNGSVPTLADLLEPASKRPISFAVGPAYDLAKLGLASDQPGSTFTLKTTGCDAAGLASGDSNCGHEYGTQLPDADKKALLEYMKTL